MCSSDLDVQLRGDPAAPRGAQSATQLRARCLDAEQVQQRALRVEGREDVRGDDLLAAGECDSGDPPVAFGDRGHLRTGADLGAEAPRRIGDGVMMCKPLVLSSGEWALPISRWKEHDESAQLIVSTDSGKTWTRRGGCNVPKDEIGRAHV